MSIDQIATEFNLLTPRLSFMYQWKTIGITIENQFVSLFREFKYIHLFENNNNHNKNKFKNNNYLLFELCMFYNRQ